MNAPEQIYELLEYSGKPAPDMTAALKMIGNGNMHDGLLALTDYFKKIGSECGYARGMKHGEIKGIIDGSLATTGIMSVIAGGRYLKKRIYNKKTIKKEEAIILKSLKKAVPEDHVETACQMADPLDTMQKETN